MQGGVWEIPAGRTCRINANSLEFDRPILIQGQGQGSKISCRVSPCFALDKESDHRLEISRVAMELVDEGSTLIYSKKTTYSSGQPLRFDNVIFTAMACSGKFLEIEGGGIQASGVRASGNAFCEQAGKKQELDWLSIHQVGESYCQGYNITDSDFNNIRSVVRSRAEKWELAAGLIMTNVRVVWTASVVDVDKFNSIAITAGMFDQIPTPFILLNTAPFMLSNSYLGGIPRAGEPLIRGAGISGSWMISLNGFARYFDPPGKAVDMGLGGSLWEEGNTYGGSITHQRKETSPTIEQSGMGGKGN